MTNKKLIEMLENFTPGDLINHLKIVDTVYQSNTQFFANKACLADPKKKAIIDDMLVLINGVLNGRKRVLLEMNCKESIIKDIVKILPSMRSPTISQLYQSNDFSIKSAVKRSEVKSIIPQLIKAGATDILEIAIRKSI